MSVIKSYIIRLVAASIIVSCSTSLTTSSPVMRKLIKLLSNLFLIIIIIVPLRNISFENLDGYFDSVYTDADIYTEYGINSAKDNYKEHIKAKLETYILDKAENMGLSITAEVELSNDEHNFPCSVTVKGDIAPYAKEILTAFIEDNLGIAKENQHWS